jgi:hypothetical protein
MNSKNKKTFLIFLVSVVCAVSGLLFLLILNGRAGKTELEDPPIITSATYQHTLYNGRNQPIEAAAAKNDTPPFVVTYFPSEGNLEQNVGGRAEPPSEVGDYYARISRPAGNGYRQGKDIKVEYHIQKAIVDIKTEAEQRFRYDGYPKAVNISTEIVTLDGGEPASLDLSCAYFAGENLLPGPPSERGVYQVHVSYSGSAYHMGASKEISLIIE